MMLRLTSIVWFGYLSLISLCLSQNCEIIINPTPTDYPTTDFPTTQTSRYEHIFKENDVKEKSRADAYVRIPEDQDPSTPFAIGTAVNLALVFIRSVYYRAVLKEENVVEFYVTPAFSDYTDKTRDTFYNEFSIPLRCEDGTMNELRIYPDIIEVNNRSPVFSRGDLFSLSASQAWPIEIPITQNKLLFIRDEDYYISSATITLTASPNIVTHRLIKLFPEGSDSNYLPYDYRVDIFLKEGLNVGTTIVQLQASDGVHTTYSYLNLTITEAACKGSPQKPVFGIRGESEGVTYYNSTLRSIPRAGQALPGVEIVAFDPEDQFCEVNVIIDSDIFQIGAEGQVIFSRSLTETEIESKGSTWILEVQATGVKSGQSTSIPLIVSLDIHTDL